MVARAILVQAKAPQPLQKSLKTMPGKKRIPRDPPNDAPADKPPAKIWEIEARLDKHSEEIANLMKAAGLTRVSAEATERSKMMEYFDKTKKECDRLLAMMNTVTVSNGEMLKERTDKMHITLENVRARSGEALQEARAVKVSLKKDNADIQKALMDLKGLDAKLTECFKNSMRRVDALQAELEDTATKDSQIITDLDNLTVRVKDLEARYHVKNLHSRRILQARVEEIGGRVTLLARNVASQEVAEQADGGDKSSDLHQEVDVCQKAAELMRTRVRSASPVGKRLALAPPLKLPPYVAALASAHDAAPASDLASAPVSDHVAAPRSAPGRYAKG